METELNYNGLVKEIRDCVRKSLGKYVIELPIDLILQIRKDIYDNDKENEI